MDDPARLREALANAENKYQNAINAANVTYGGPLGARFTYGAHPPHVSLALKRKLIAANAPIAFPGFQEG